MSNRILFVWCLVLLGSSFVACVETSSTGSGTTTETATEQTPDERSIDAPATGPAAPECTLNGEVLDGNTYWLKDKDLLVAIVATEETNTEDFGPSHRVLQLLDGRSCEVLHTETLPVNSSPDFPYYLAPIQYNKVSNLIGIQGVYDVLICDVGNENKLTKLAPEFFAEREYDDPQTGMIQHLEVWENYLLGSAQGVGTFAFDLSDMANPKPVLPFAEWMNQDAAGYHSLYLMPAEDGYQGIMPEYDVEAEEFVLHPVFDTPQKISLNVQKSARNNQHLVLRNAEDNTKVYPINLGTRDLMDVPADILSQNSKTIVDWMEAQ